MTTFAIIAPGAMGSSIARRLRQNDVRVLTVLTGRSSASVARAKAAGMEAVEAGEHLQESDIFLSIVPPAGALAVAEEFARHSGRTTKAPVFIDCNAISVSEVVRIAAILEGAGVRFIYGCIIGAPPQESGPGPTLYVAGAHSPDLNLLTQAGISVRTIDGPVGAATALKLSYAGITKGLTAIAAAMILAAERAGAGDGLRAELAASQPQLLARFQKSIPDMYPKAYRWVEEMRAISEFVGATFPEKAFYDGAAALFERIAREDAGGERRQLTSFLSDR